MIFRKERKLLKTLKSFAASLIVFSVLASQLTSPVFAKNPLVSANSVLFQWDYLGKLGPIDHYLTLNIQPAFPFHLNDKVDMIAYSDLPVNSQMRMVYASAPAMNIGDFQQYFFFSAADSDSVYLGIGPVFSFPTATNPNLASNKWGIGPAVQAAVFGEKISYGVIGYYMCSYAGDPSRPNINRTYWNPWLTFNINKDYNVGVQTEPYCDFNTGQWQIPLEAYVNRFISINNQPVKLTLDGLWWAVAPSAFPQWSARFNITLFYPKN